MPTNLLHGSKVTVYAGAARTATPAVAEFLVADRAIRGIMIAVNVTANAATPSVVPTLKIKVDGTWVTLKAFTAITNITGNGLYLYIIYPGISDLGLSGIVIDEVVAYPIPTNFEFSMVHADTDSITYAVNLECLR